MAKFTENEAASPTVNVVLPFSRPHESPHWCSQPHLLRSWRQILKCLPVKRNLIILSHSIKLGNSCDHISKGGNGAKAKFSAFIDRITISIDPIPTTSYFSVPQRRCDWMNESLFLFPYNLRVFAIHWFNLWAIVLVSLPLLAGKLVMTHEVSDTVESLPQQAMCSCARPGSGRPLTHTPCCYSHSTCWTHSRVLPCQHEHIWNVVGGRRKSCASSCVGTMFESFPR